MRLILLLHQAREHPHVAGEARVRRVEQQGRDLRGDALAVAVDAAVALLDADE